MKHDTVSQAERLQHLASLAGVLVTPETAFEMCAHLGLVLAAADTINVTAISDPEAALRLHVVDSLCAEPEVRSLPQGELCDLGSGAGYPGIPLALATGRHVLLLESVRKKAEFLCDVVARLGIDRAVSVAPIRSEQAAIIYRGRFSGVLARAVAGLPALAEMARPLLCNGGALVALKGNISEAELASGKTAARMVGMEQESVREYALPGGAERRSVVVYVVTGDPTVELPRRPGMATKRPLGQKR